MAKPKKIMVAVEVWEDATLELAKKAIAMAAPLCQPTAGTLMLVAVAPPPRPLVGFDISGEVQEVLMEIRDQELKLGEERLKELITHAESLDAKAEFELVDRPDLSVAKNLVDCAAREAVDVLVVTTHGHKGIKRALLGSVAAKVAHHSTRPVLLLPPDA